MFPIKDNIPSRLYPIITVILILTNIFVFLFEISLGENLNFFIRQFGIIPVKYFTINSFAAFESFFYRYLPLLTSMFLHGGWLHLFGNMYFLWIFGDNVEDKMGHFRFLIFYILCGIIAGLTHIYTNPHSTLPTIGASGAIAGVLGAYFVLYPGAQILTLIPFGFFLHMTVLPAFVFLGFWFVAQFLNLFLSFALVDKEIGGVAWMAHIGGFVSGAILVFLFKKHKARARYKEYYRW